MARKSLRILFFFTQICGYCACWLHEEWVVGGLLSSRPTRARRRLHLLRASSSSPFVSSASLRPILAHPATPYSTALHTQRGLPSALLLNIVQGELSSPSFASFRGSISRPPFRSSQCRREEAVACLALRGTDPFQDAAAAGAASADKVLPSPTLHTLLLGWEVEAAPRSTWVPPPLDGRRASHPCPRARLHSLYLLPAAGRPRAREKRCLLAYDGHVLHKDTVRQALVGGQFEHLQAELGLQHPYVELVLSLCTCEVHLLAFLAPQRLLAQGLWQRPHHGVAAPPEAGDAAA